MLMCQELTLTDEATFRKGKSAPSSFCLILEGLLQLSLSGG